tara:strand:- start:3729 stop:4571 length:843 start_codon:yes stop_codon:yes gene_type:complete
MKSDLNPFDLDKMYEQYIDNKNDENYEERYKNNEGWYRASSAGFCSRKMYYESVMKLEPTIQPSKESKMKMRLGTIFHDEVQGALKSFSPQYIYKYIYNTDINTDNIYIKEKDKYIKEKEKKVEVHVEGNIQIDDLNVRGHYDIVFDAGKVYLYDIKTIGSYPWKLRFGRNRTPEHRAYPLQLGTYALGVEEKFGRIDGMFLYFYNKDTSKTKTTEVPMIWKSKAYMYWESINEEHAKGLPELNLGQSPEKAWACNYCGFKDICKPDGFIKEQKSKGVWR